LSEPEGSRAAGGGCGAGRRLCPRRPGRRSLSQPGRRADPARRWSRRWSSHVARAPATCPAGAGWGPTDY